MRRPARRTSEPWVGVTGPAPTARGRANASPGGVSIPGEPWRLLGVSAKCQRRRAASARPNRQAVGGLGRPKPRIGRAASPRAGRWSCCHGPGVRAGLKVAGLPLCARLNRPGGALPAESRPHPPVPTWAPTRLSRTPPPSLLTAGQRFPLRQGSRWRWGWQPWCVSAASTPCTTPDTTIGRALATCA